jgi:hypothetical protein
MSLWSERDEPVLRWLSDNPPRANILHTNWSSDQAHDGLPSMTATQFHRAVETLCDAGYVASDDPVGASGGGVSSTRFHVTGAGKQALGLWPRFDALAEPGELADILDALADNAPTDEQAGYLRRVAEAVRCAAPSVIRGLAVAGLSAGARTLLGI